MSTYPKPGNAGGTIVRKMIALLRAASAIPDEEATIHLACSGGADSVALAHLIRTYGRRIAFPERLRLLHVNHGWRGRASDDDAQWVQDLGRSWNLPVDVVTLEPADRAQEGESWENAAREARNAVFAARLNEYPGVVLTAHHGDDLAETFLWRLFTGTAEVEAGSIAIQASGVVRPLLAVRRAELRAYLLEEGLCWREDATNHEGRFLRSKMRQRLMPEVDSIFPRAVEHLMKLALKAQGRSISSAEPDAFRTLFQAAGLRPRSAHWRSLEEKARIPGWSGEFSLPGGWKLSKEKSGESWRLEKSETSKSSEKQGN